MNKKSQITEVQINELFQKLKLRFEKNVNRHPNISWTEVLNKLSISSNKIWSLYQMEITGGEPDVTGFDKATGEYLFMDCSIESPTKRRSLCYDRAGLDSRKDFKPVTSAVDMAVSMGIELLTELQYHTLQKLGNVDLKTSSWLQTPEEIRKLGGAIFGDFRFGKVFIYHNGAQSYYAGRGFRGILKV